MDLLTTSELKALAVIRAGHDFELLAVNTLDDSFAASPALAGDNSYLRGDRFLYLRNAELWSEARTSYSKEPATRSTTPDTSAHQRVTTTRSLSGSQTTEFPPAPDAAKVASLAALPKRW